MTKEEALKQFAMAGAVWFGNSKQHFAFSAYDRFNGWNKLADKWIGKDSISTTSTNSATRISSSR